MELDRDIIFLEEVECELRGDVSLKFFNNKQRKKFETNKKKRLKSIKEKGEKRKNCLHKDGDGNYFYIELFNSFTNKKEYKCRYCNKNLTKINSKL